MSTFEERLRRTSLIRSLQLGDLKISYVPDGVVALKPYGWLPAATEQDWQDNAAYLDDDGNLVATIGGLLIEYGERALMIDAGVGPVSMPDDPGNERIGALRGGDLLGNLAELGRTPEDIEAVAFTHLHPDHLGWAHHLAPGSDRPAFGRAAYLFGEPEWTQRHLSAVNDITGEMLATMEPQARTVADGEEVFPGVRAMFTPGHTVGHVSYTISSGGQRLIVFGMRCTPRCRFAIRNGLPAWMWTPWSRPCTGAGWSRNCRGPARSVSAGTSPTSSSAASTTPPTARTGGPWCETTAPAIPGRVDDAAARPTASPISGRFRDRRLAA